MNIQFKPASPEELAARGVLPAPEPVEATLPEALPEPVKAARKPKESKK